MAIIIRPPNKTDRAAWDTLYQGYADFYKVTQTDVMRDTVWSWLLDDSIPAYGLVAQAENGALVGLTHFRPFLRPLSASTGGFLDDLFVSHEGRGQHISDALIGGVKAHGLQLGWTVVRWITAEDNYRARGVYDRLAEKTKWTTYDIKL